MRRGAVAVLLLCHGVALAAEDAPPPADLPSPVAPGELAPPVSPARRALWATGAVGVSLASCGVAIGAGALIQNASFQAAGRPDPVVLAGALGVAMGVNMALTWLLLPQLARLGDLDGWRGDPGEGRRSAWRLARWAALGAAAGVVAFGVGGVLDKGEYGRGQGLMIVGGVAFLVSFIVWDVLDAVGAWAGTVGSRTRR